MAEVPLVACKCKTQCRCVYLLFSAYVRICSFLYNRVVYKNDLILTSLCSLFFLFSFFILFFLVFTITYAGLY